MYVCTMQCTYYRRVKVKVKVVCNFEDTNYLTYNINDSNEID